MLYQAKPIKEGGNAYAAAPHTYFDRTGKTLVITFTNMPNKIQAIRVVSSSFCGRTLSWMVHADTVCCQTFDEA